MATKTANVLARVEPEIKEQAEAILAQLGIPASTVINVLYRQIIMTKSIPFSISIPTPLCYDEMDKTAFDQIIQTGLTQAEANDSRPVSEVFSNLRREL